MKYVNINDLPGSCWRNCVLAANLEIHEIDYYEWIMRFQTWLNHKHRTTLILDEDRHPQCLEFINESEYTCFLIKYA